MKIDLNQHSVLNGIPPSGSAYLRGGKLAEGTIEKMIVLGAEYIDKGYVGVMVLYEHGSLDSTKIRELVEQVASKKEP